MGNKTAPSYLVDGFKTEQDIHTRNTRSAINNKLYLPQPNLSLYKKVFLILVLCSEITFPIIIFHQVEVLIVLNSILKNKGIRKKPGQVHFN